MFWWIILAISVTAYIALNAILLPTLLLRPKYVQQSEDRGVENVAEEGRHTVIFQPAYEFRKYIKHYALSRDEKKTVLVCQLGEGIKYVDYDVMQYNGEGKLLGMLKVKQIADTDSGVTQEVTLSGKTAYVSVRVNKANDIKVENAYGKSLPGKRAWAYIALTSVINVLASVGIRVVIAEIMGGLFKRSYMLDIWSNVIAAAVCVIVIALNVSIALTAVRRGNERYERGEMHD